jgi:hypothetical protein
MQSGSQSIYEEQLWPSELYGPLVLSESQLSIRLLRLKPGKPGAPVRCSLFRTALISSLPYEALSYTWGDPTSRSPVYVNGIEVWVTRNLERAFRTLRYGDRTRVLWIDALCINQHDIAERSRQVQEMGDIYSFADGVLIWLDCSLEHQNIVMGMVQDLAVGSSTLDPLGIAMFERSSAAKIPAISLRASQSLLNILDNPYWGRVWVVQEISRARRDPTIAIGYGKEFKLSRLVNTVRALQSGSQPVGFNLWKIVSIRDRTRTPPRLRDADTEDATPETARKHLSEDLLYLLDSTRHFKSTDPRDKIFALWTLVRGTSERRFKPDYSMSMQQVYIAVTSEIVEGLGTLRVLMFRRAKSRSDLPTWVPDYSLLPASYLNLPSPAALRVSDQSDVVGPPKTDEIDKNKLFVRGAAVDTISEVLWISPLMYQESREQSSQCERALRESKLEDLDKEICHLQERNQDPRHDNLIARREHLARMMEKHRKMTEDERSSRTAISQTQRQYAYAIIHFAHELASEMNPVGFALPADEEQQEDYAIAVETVRVARQSLDNPTLSEHFLNSSACDGGDDDHAGVDGGDSAPLLVDEAIKYAWRIISHHTFYGFSVYFFLLDKNMRRDLQDDVDRIFSTQYEKFRGEHAYLASAIKGLERMGVDWRTRILDSARLLNDECKAYRESLVRDLREQLEWYTMEQNAQRRTTAIRGLEDMPQDVWDVFDLFVQGIERQLRNLRQAYYKDESVDLQLYKTTSGLTGFGSGDLRVDDRVALLDGLPSVCIIRKSENPHAASNEYTFHGCTFFNGAESATSKPRDLTYAPLVLV